MKKNLLLFFALISLGCSVSARILTVSNRTESPAQYASLQVAYDAALNGDTILVTGSLQPYTGLAISKRICLLGQGYDPRKDVAYSSKLGNIDFISGSSGSVIAGFEVPQINLYSDSLVIKRNKINRLNLSRNFLVRENIIFEFITVNQGSFVATDINMIANNVIFGSIQCYNNGVILTITNNYFAGGGGSLIVQNAVVANNIFYPKTLGAATQPFVVPAYGGNVWGSSTYNNNIYFNTANANPFSIGVDNNTGVGNLAVDPLFVNIDLVNSSLTAQDNFQLRSNSPGKNAGTDGKDIGCYGGTLPLQYPLSGEPAIPQIRTMNISNTVIPPNGTLNVNVKAGVNN